MENNFRRNRSRLLPLLVLGMAGTCLPNLHALDLPESTNKLVFARKLDREYVNPLGMSGKPASYAFATLLGEGFRCDLRLVSPIGLDQPPISDCFKSPSGFGPQCNELKVVVRFERQPEIASREELFQRLDSVLVHSAMAFCPYPDEVPAEFVAAQPAAEKTLTGQVSALGLIGDASVAYKKLLMQGYSCGFATQTDGEAASPAGPAQMVCTSRWTRIRRCHEAKVVMDMDWPSGLSSIKDFYGALPGAQVKTVRSSCEIPKVRAGGSHTGREA